MDVLILDEFKSRKVKLCEALEKRRCKVVQCSTSNDFISSINASLPNLILLDMETWHRGRSIYSYFQIAKKFEHVPVLFYDAPQNFTALPDRIRHDKDRVVEKPAEVDAILNVVMHGL